MGCGNSKSAAQPTEQAPCDQNKAGQAEAPAASAGQAEAPAASAQQEGDGNKTILAGGGAQATQIADETAKEPIASPDAAKPASEAPCPTFRVGDRVTCKEDGTQGTVVYVYDDANPKVLIDGEDEPRARYGPWFDVIEKPITPASKFSEGDRVRCIEDNKEGQVVAAVDDAAVQVLIDGEETARQGTAEMFELIVRPPSKFSEGDRVRCIEDNKEGQVVAAVDDAAVLVFIDGEETARQGTAEMFELIVRPPTEPEEDLRNVVPKDPLSSADQIPDFSSNQLDANDPPVTNCCSFGWFGASPGQQRYGQ